MHISLFEFSNSLLKKLIAVPTLSVLVFIGAVYPQRLDSTILWGSVVNGQQDQGPMDTIDPFDVAFSDYIPEPSHLQSREASDITDTVDPYALYINEDVAPESNEPSKDDIRTYIVQSGDSLADVAALFDIDVKTIKWVNNLKSEKLKEGDELIILPLDGVQITVEKGDTLSGIAKAYQVSSKDIIDFNEIDESKIVAGTELIIPGGEPLPEKPKVTKKPSSSSSSSKSPSRRSPTRRVRGLVQQDYYIYPLSSWNPVSRRCHGRVGAIDVASPTGTPAVSVADGVIEVNRVNGQWNGGYGNYITVRHDNGATTLYAHLSSGNVKQGQRVSQGEVIGRTGNTGRSTGPHLHFELRNSPSGIRACDLAVIQ